MDETILKKMLQAAKTDGNLAVAMHKAEPEGVQGVHVAVTVGAETKDNQTMLI